jgi:orotidine-5'-phosphate decarboxylase
LVSKTPIHVPESIFTIMKKSPREYLALALDNISSLPELADLVKTTAPSIGVYKIGLEQFTRFGPPIFEVVRNADRKVFLDLKFHDIPNTVGKAVESAVGLGVDFLTVHTQGGIAMMRAAKAAAETARKKSGSAPKILGVTLLTSIDAACLQKELGVAMAMGDFVRHLATCAIEASLDGIVCSAADLPLVKPLLPEDFEIITPGIRPTGTTAHDQKRIATPKEAINNGATLLVLGRAVTGADNPGKAAEEILLHLSV